MDKACLPLELVNTVVFEDYGSRGSEFRFDRSDIATTLERAHGVEVYDGMLDDIDNALLQLYRHGIEPCIGAGRAGALWNFGPGKPPRSQLVPLVGSPG